MATESYPTSNLIIYDTSAVVEYWKRNLGTVTTVDQLKERLDADGGCTEIIPTQVIREYGRLYREKITDGQGLPKYNASGLALMLKYGAVKDLPADVTSPEQRIISRDFWSRKSPKGLLGKNVSHTDLDILSFARVMAQRGYNCYVVTYDSDIATPCAYMRQEDKLSVFPVGYEHAQSIKDFVEGENFRAIMLLENAMVDLFNIPEGTLGYLVVTKIKLVDQKVDVGLNVGNSLPGKKLQEGDVTRIPLTIFDIEGMPDSEKGYMMTDEDYERIDEFVAKRSLPFLSYLMKAYKECKYVNIGRIKNFGILEISEMKIRGRAIRTRMGVRRPNLNLTFLVPYFLQDHYMTSHYPETLDVILRRARQYN